MKRNVLLFFVLIGIIMCGFSGIVLGQQKPIELSFNLMMQPTHLRYVGAIKPWIDELEKRTQGRVKVVPYFSATLSPLPENYESAVTGVADIAEAFVGLTPGRFPVSEIMNLADIRPTCKNTSRVIWDIYKKFPEARKEFSDTHIIAIYCTGWQFLFTGKKPVRTLEEVKGLKVMSPAKAISDTGRALGFTPVTVGLGDVYTAADKGVIDGAVLPTDLLEGRKLAEVFHYGTKVSLGYNTFYLAMNKKKYESLPADIRKAIDDVGGDHIVDLYAKIWLKLDEQGAKYAVEKEKFQFIELSPSELARWEKAVKPIWDAKEAELEAKGLPGKKIIQELRANLAKYSK